MPPETPLRDPVAYFRRSDRPSLRLGTILVVVNTVATAVIVWLFMDAVIRQIAPSAAAAAEVRNALGGTLMWTVLAAPVGWLLIGAVVHFFVWMADGSRGYGHTLAVMGESQLVSIVLLPVTALGFYLLLQQVPDDPAAAAEFFRRARNGGSPLLLLASLVGALWRAFVQAVGLSETHDVGVGKMAVITFVLAVLAFFGKYV